MRTRLTRSTCWWTAWRYTRTMEKQILASLEHGQLLGEGFISLHMILPPGSAEVDEPGDEATLVRGKKRLPTVHFYDDFACPNHGDGDGRGRAALLQL